VGREPEEPAVLWWAVRLPLATAIGLLLALAGPPLASFIADLQGTEQTPARIGWGVVVHWINLAAVVFVVLRAERRPLASIGLRPFKWWTIPLGLVAGIVATVATGYLAQFLTPSNAGVAPFVATLLSLPFAMRLVLVITAGVFEETLYRGYAFERLAGWFNSKWAAAGVTVLLFTLGHAPVVGLDRLLPIFIVSSLITLLYLWRRDLVVNMVAHATVDAIALLVAPALAHAGG
jgi:membrane protease YdiL (CAAX protease family)